jgi:multidrug transporter EmrE-like cation transporter
MQTSSIAAMLPAIFATVILNGSAQIFLRMALKSSELGVIINERDIAGLIKIATSPWTITGLSAYVISVMLWMLVLSKIPASTAYPFMGLAFLFVLVTGVLFLGEQFSAGKLVGSLMVVFGVALISRY